MTNHLTITTADELLTLALALGAATVATWSSAENKLVAQLPPIELNADIVKQTQQAIRAGQDPLGELFCTLYSADDRRPQGAIYSPGSIVAFMMTQAQTQSRPGRVIDVGAGSARFLVAAGRTFDDAALIGVELDPFASLLARGHLAAAGLAQRSQIVNADYRDFADPFEGTTLYIGNPPYVRHHQIPEHWKSWLTAQAAQQGIRASQLAGLHAYFFLATARQARTGDHGLFITSSEWLDVNYGNLVRELLLDRLGGLRFHVVEPTAEPFPGTQTTAVITEFTVGGKPPALDFRRVSDAQQLHQPARFRTVRRDRLVTAERWSPLTFEAMVEEADMIELGELFRVHRGQVTGANKIWIASKETPPLPNSVLFPSVTKAKELFQAGKAITDTAELRRVIDLPLDLSTLDRSALQQVEHFLKFAKARGGDSGFVASHRKAWWSVGLRTAAPVLVTYMARRPPAFVQNTAEARHINVAHGLYPRDDIAPHVFDATIQYLNDRTSVQQGRTYSGGLTKFEPREIERLRVPHPDILRRLLPAQALL